jgi:hypothetical protein
MQHMVWPNAMKAAPWYLKEVYRKYTLAAPPPCLSVPIFWNHYLQRSLKPNWQKSPPHFPIPRECKTFMKMGAMWHKLWASGTDVPSNTHSLQQGQGTSRCHSCGLLWGNAIGLLGIPGKNNVCCFSTIFKASGFQQTTAHSLNWKFNQ